MPQRVWRADDVPCSAPDPGQRLLCAVIARAARDACGAELYRVPMCERDSVQSDAIDWLATTGADLCAEWLDIEAVAVRAWLARLGGNGNGHR